MSSTFWHSLVSDFHLPQAHDPALTMIAGRKHRRRYDTHQGEATLPFSGLTSDMNRRPEYIYGVLLPAKIDDISSRRFAPKLTCPLKTTCPFVASKVTSSGVPHANQSLSGETALAHIEFAGSYARYSGNWYRLFLLYLYSLQSGAPQEVG